MSAFLWTIILLKTGALALSFAYLPKVSGTPYRHNLFWGIAVDGVMMLWALTLLSSIA